jgi:hypothetical protein
VSARAANVRSMRLNVMIACDLEERHVVDLAYMNRWQWAAGFRMVENSRPVHSWLGGARHVAVVADRSQLEDTGYADIETLEHISPVSTRAVVVEFAELDRLNVPVDVAILFVHPVSPAEQESARRFVSEHEPGKAFVMVWREQDRIRLWLEGRRAANLLRGEPVTLPDALALKAAEAMVYEEYNSLKSGRGKDTVIHAVRALHAEGSPLAPEYWARAVLMSGGKFESVEVVAGFVKEMAEGRRHRVQPRFRENIVEIWRQALAEASSAGR